MLDELFQVLGEISVMVHAHIELMVPIHVTEGTTFGTDASPRQPPMDEIHIGASFRIEFSP